MLATLRGLLARPIIHDRSSVCQKPRRWEDKNRFRDCESVHALSLPDWASLVCLPESEVPRYLSARGKFLESLILGRLVQQPRMVCLPVSGGLHFLCRVDGRGWDRPVSTDAILSGCALHYRCLLLLCDRENVRQPLFSNRCRCRCERVLVPASSLAPEP